MIEIHVLPKSSVILQFEVGPHYWKFNVLIDALFKAQSIAFIKNISYLLSFFFYRYGKRKEKMFYVNCLLFKDGVL